MEILQEVDKPGSDVEAYATSLDSILAHKMEVIGALRKRLTDFRGHLKEEQELSKKFFEQQNEMKDVYDMQTKGSTDDAQMLTHDLESVMGN